MSDSLKGKPVTVVYEIVDEAEWRKTNPLIYQHHGLKALGASADDLMAKSEAMQDELERLERIVCAADRQSIRRILESK